MNHSSFFHLVSLPAPVVLLSYIYWISHLAVLNREVPLIFQFLSVLLENNSVQCLGIFAATSSSFVSMHTFYKVTLECV